jgi:transglutaminase-like putative cysteine protease
MIGALVIATAVGMTGITSFAAGKTTYSDISKAMENRTALKVNGLEVAKVRDYFYKASFQNPYILDENGFSLNGTGNDTVLKVNYLKGDISYRTRQKAVKKEVNRVLKEIMKPGMTDFEKEKAINDYMVDNVRYPKVNVGSQNSVNQLGDESPDLFNPYGALVDKVAVCEGYAQAFKLLCNKAGLECIVVTGSMNGVGHGWNKVKLGGVWYNIDVTINATGMNYSVFNVSDNVAKKYYRVDSNWEVDDRTTVKKYNNANDNSKEYFRATNSLVNNADDIKRIVGEGKIEFRAENDMSVGDVQSALEGVMKTYYAIRYGMDVYKLELGRD